MEVLNTIEFDTRLFKLRKSELKLLYYCKSRRSILEIADDLGYSYNYVAGVLERLSRRGFLLKLRFKREVRYVAPIKYAVQVDELLNKRNNAFLNFN